LHEIFFEIFILFSLISHFPCISCIFIFHAYAVDKSGVSIPGMGIETPRVLR